MTKHLWMTRRRTIALGAILVAAGGVVWAQQNLPDAGGEYTVAQNSWPNEIKAQLGGATMPMGEALRAIVDKGLIDLSSPATPAATKVDIKTAIAAAMRCGCYDGYVPVDPASPPTPLPVHNQKYGETPDKSGHMGAKAKVVAAYNAVFPTAPAVVNWKTCSDELNHGH